MRIPRVFFRYIHQYTACCCRTRVKDEINHQPAGVFHDSNGLRPHRPGDVFETRLLIELPRLLEPSYPDTNVIDSPDLFHIAPVTRTPAIFTACIQPVQRLNAHKTRRL